jgi:hypothetical protein
MICLGGIHYTWNSFDKLFYILPRFGKKIAIVLTKKVEEYEMGKLLVIPLNKLSFYFINKTLIFFKNSHDYFIYFIFFFCFSQVFV